MQSIRVMIFTLFGLFSFCSASVFALSAAHSDWQHEISEHDVTVESRLNQHGYFEVRASTKVKSHPMALMALLDDTDAAPSWIARCKRVETLKWFGREERTVHTYFSAPWPFSDRDMVTFSRTLFDPLTGVLSIKVEDKGREHATLSHYVRMENISGLWWVTPIEKDIVEIVYEGYGDAAGSIPGWIANRLMVSSTHETFVNLRTMITLDKYQQQANASITD